MMLFELLDSYDAEIAAGRNKNTDIGRNDGQKINDAEKTSNIQDRFTNAVDSEKIFYGKKQCENPLHDVQSFPIQVIVILYTIQQNHNYTEEDTDN